MFDPETSKLIQAAPSVGDIKSSDLPRLLTEIYTQLVTERVRGIQDENTIESTERLREIANTYESIAVTNLDSEISRASAFVSGTAYQILSKTVVGSTDDGDNDNVLNRDHISGDLAAALLFLIAQQLPDAREAIQRFKGVGQSEPSVVQDLAYSLIDLVKENFGAIVLRAAERNSASYTGSAELNGAERATNHLYQHILRGIENLSSIIIGDNKRLDDQQPIDLFREVLTLSTRSYTIPGLNGQLLSTYPGPAHLATLLANLAQTLLNASILLLTPPGGSDEKLWGDWLAFRATQKPLLWPNHRIAVDRDFHHLGVSAVLVLPTGAGKTTISEFKIAATLSAGKQVVFLAPTNALVDQLKDDLKVSMPSEIFGIDQDYDADLLTTVKESLPGLSIMTPEKCLAVLNFNPQAFENVGLIIFDECHSLSAEAGSMRRALDGMLVVLRLIALLRDLDFLFMSAMIQDPQTFADWIAELTNKSCVVIDLLWKPSRQARGVVIYPEQQIREVQHAATAVQQQMDQDEVAKGKKISKDARSKPKKMLRAIPYALFGLVNNWHPDRPQDIRIRKLAEENCELNCEFTQERELNAKTNGNGVSRQIGVASASAGLKTIVFMNNTLWVNKSASETGAALTFSIQYNNHEAKLFRAIETEFGKAECSIMHNLLRCVPHHADLIPFERQLAESLYRREDGARIIFATTTLSQGMNLPAQVAILSSNERAALGGQYVTQEPMKAHELLNAAGRAGRAGFLANGLVILVPRTLLTFNNNGIAGENAHEILHSIIPEDERCVPVVDPLGQILDQVQQGLPVDDDREYLFHRLGNTHDTEDAEKFLRKSLGYFVARKKGNQATFDRAIAAFSKQVMETEVNTKIADWLMQISIQSGIAPKIIDQLYNSLDEQFENLPATVSDWVNWLIDWLSHNPEAGRFCFGADFTPLQTIGGVEKINGNNYQATLHTLKSGMVSWLGGLTLMEVEKSMGGTLKLQKVICPKARELATNAAPRCLSYFSTFITQIVKNISVEKGIALDILAVLESLPSAITQGADTPEKLAFMQLTKSRYRSRVEAHTDFNARFGKLSLPHSISYYDTIQVIANQI